VLLGGLAEAAAGLTAEAEGQGHGVMLLSLTSKSPHVGLDKGTQHTCNSTDIIAAEIAPAAACMARMSQCS
jgi:hypothetical protein